MKSYKAIFFDLDHTLWDFEMNSRETLSELFEKHETLINNVKSAEHFIDEYRMVNHQMWDDYHKNIITKEVLRFGRFNRTLKKFNIEDAELAEELSSQYLEICPTKKNLFPGTHSVLEYLQAKYSLHIITNGFKEVQYVKIKNSGIEKYFSNIHISEEIGFKKPEVEIFDYAVRQAKTSHDKCIMIGDNLETDIAGAKNAGIDTLFFNPSGQPTTSHSERQIISLNELLNIL